MKRLIAEEEGRKRLRKAEEEAERIAQEKAKQELGDRQRRELEERRKALAKKRADLEEKNRRLEVNGLERCRVCCRMPLSVYSCPSEAERQACFPGREKTH